MSCTGGVFFGGPTWDGVHGSAVQLEHLEQESLALSQTYF